MKIYTFETDGQSDEYYRVGDVRAYFTREMFRTDVLDAINTVRSIIRERKIEFRNDTMMRIKAVKEVDNVLQILIRCSDQFPKLQKEMFQ